MENNKIWYVKKIEKLKNDLEDEIMRLSKSLQGNIFEEYKESIKNEEYLIDEIKKDLNSL